MKKKLLSVLLVICMVLTLMPMAALADFADTDGHWGKDSIDRWAEYGVLNGKGENSFDPNGNMTRAEFAQMLCNMMGYTKKAANTFTDIPDDAWYADAMLKLVEAGVINGVGNGLAAPNAPITRETAAVMLCRAFNLKESSASMSYSDAGSVASWAQGAVAALTEKGMMNGVGDNKVAPQLNINRASVAKLLDNMVAEYVTEDKTITGEVKGIILVVGDADVTFEGVTGDAAVVVAPSAEGASVTVDKDSEIESVTVAAENAEAKVEGTVEDVTVAAEGAKAEVGKDATVGTVTVAAENAEAKVEGTAGTVTAAAEGAKVEVGKDATVGTVTVDAAGASAQVDGKVENLDVNAGSATTGKDSEVGTLTTTPDAESVKVDGKVETAVADGTKIDTGANAEIKDVTISGENAGVTGSGKVENATVTEDATGAEVSTPGTNVENNSSEKVGDVEPGETGETGTPSTSTGSSGSSSGTPAGPTVTFAQATGSGYYGKKASDMVAAVEMTTSGKNVIVTGVAKYISNWTSFSSVNDEQAGNYLPIKITVGGSEETTVTITGSKTTTVTVTGVDRDIELVMRLNELTNDKFTVKVGSTTYTVNVKGMTLDSQDDNTPTVTVGYGNSVAEIKTGSGLAAGNIRPQTVWAELDTVKNNENYFMTLSYGDKTVGTAIDTEEDGKKTYSLSLFHKEQCELWPNGTTVADFEGRECTVKVYKADASAAGESGSVMLNGTMLTKGSGNDSTSIPLTLIGSGTVNVTKSVIAATLEDHPSGEDDAPINTLGDVTAKATGEFRNGSSNTILIIPVEVNVTGLVKHHNANNTEGYWAGIGVPWSSSDKCIAKWELINGSETINSATDKDNDMTEEGQDYATFYFNLNNKTLNGDGTKGYVAVKDSDGVVVIYEITFKGTLAPESTPASTSLDVIPEAPVEDID